MRSMSLWIKASAKCIIVKIKNHMEQKKVIPESGMQIGSWLWMDGVCFQKRLVIAKCKIPAEMLVMKEELFQKGLWQCGVEGVGNNRSISCLTDNEMGKIFPPECSSDSLGHRMKFFYTDTVKSLSRAGTNDKQDI